MDKKYENENESNIEILTKFISLLLLLSIGLVLFSFFIFFFFISLLARPDLPTVLFFETEPALVKFELWNLTVFMISIVFQRLSRNFLMIVCILTRISLADHAKCPRAVGEYEVCLLSVIMRSVRTRERARDGKWNMWTTGRSMFCLQNQSFSPRSIY